MQIISYTRALRWLMSWVLFRLRSRKSQSSLHWGLHSLFLSNAIRVTTSSKKTSKRWTERKKPNKGKMTWPCFVSTGHKNNAQSPWKNSEGGQFAVFRKNLDFLRLQMRLGCVLEERENAIIQLYYLQYLSLLFINNLSRCCRKVTKVI